MTTTEPLPIFCGDCGNNQTVVGKIASDLHCEKCGSTNMGIEGVDKRPTPVQVNLSAEAMARIAVPKGPGSGWYQPSPDKLQGWNEYAGPTPQTFPRIPPVADSTTCPVCHGSGYDLIDKAKCRECGGTGTITHATDRPATLDNDATTQSSPAGGAGWHGASRIQVNLTTEAQRRIAGFSDEHVSRYVDWAKSRKYNPDEVDTLKRYEREPGVGRSHTNFLADQLYIGGGESNWRSNRQASRTAVGRPNTKDPYGPEYQLRHTSPEYAVRNQEAPQGVGGPNGSYSPHDNEAQFPRFPNRSPATDFRQDRDYSAPAGPYQMNEASCPNCGHAPTELRKDKNEDAWWHCPRCGPLANVDARPDVNPYSPPQGFEPDRNMKTGGFLSRNRKTGRLLSVLATIHEANDLNCREAVELARKTIATYRDGR